MEFWVKIGSNLRTCDVCFLDAAMRKTTVNKLLFFISCKTSVLTPRAFSSSSVSRWFQISKGKGGTYEKAHVPEAAKLCLTLFISDGKYTSPQIKTKRVCM